MVKICRTGLLKLNFEIVPKKRIFRFLPKISAGHGWSWKIFFANFQTLGPLGCQGWVVIPQNVKKSQNHCTLLWMVIGQAIPKNIYPSVTVLRINQTVGFALYWHSLLWISAHEIITIFISYHNPVHHPKSKAWSAKQRKDIFFGIYIKYYILK